MVVDVTAVLRKRKCAPLAGGSAPLRPEAIEPLLEALHGWSLENGMLTRTFRFSSYQETMAFVNATAWVSGREDHHPDLQVGYNQCKVSYLTHAIDGLSDNDFICAAKIDALFDL
jgi:4a-hydroxytetrahydrobiopterin dehydratase